MVVFQSRRRNDGESIPIIDDASQPLRPFTYEPLDSDSHSDSFRLVKIEPSLNENDTLSRKLVSTEFGEKPRFRALLCMLGDDTAKKSIMLNGAEFHFWVDAICINQNNIPERNKQLMIRKRIYSRAESVAAWLGREYERFEQVAGARNDRVVFENIHTEGPQESGSPRRVQFGQRNARIAEHRVKGRGYSSFFFPTRTRLTNCKPNTLLHHKISQLWLFKTTTTKKHPG
ncbi:hypothetical protein BHYA_0192g00280 [Botrytis hyacinthi]|uniref:Heterokaryon incompatibility domain-containing protein n=1 Tax=Botrytis hyacinthi TaxID=278943 RepID=A0A4Z1GC94_9HELO|nr:hypothetical protein BHYA_0192g00280 [Botrytis hyacinthi]